MDSQQIILLVIMAAVFGGMMFLPQFQARRRREKQMAALSVGDEVMTVGGIVGTLTEIDAEENLARLEVAPGVEIQILMAAISRPRESGKPE